jgi:molecular chaperone GrpE (heat shock protein)
MNSVVKKLTNNSINTKLAKKFSSIFLAQGNKRNLNSKISMNTNFSYLLNSNYNSIKPIFYTNLNRGFFSSSSDTKNKEKTEDEEENKKKEDTTKENTEKENTSNKKKKVEEESEDEEERAITRGKYKELKSLYNEQGNKLEVVRKKFDDVRRAYLDNVQETEQIKVRYDREIANTKEFAITKFSKDVLEVYDNFDRALGSIKDVQIEKLSEDEKIETFNNFLEGMYL